MKHVFVGFGFGPIQAGLFAKEARESGNFSDIAVAEVDQVLVDAVRRNGNRYSVNVACKDRLGIVEVEGVQLLNPRNPGDRSSLLEIFSRATEIVTSLPSVNFFSSGGADSVSSLLAEGLQSNKASGTIVYTAENNNHAAEILQEKMEAEPLFKKGHRPVQFLNTVIGKMSQVVIDPKAISGNLVPIAPGFPRAFLVEEFNHILVTKVNLSGFEPGITVFDQKTDLLPFEEAKLFGHNAINTMLGFIAGQNGLKLMSELRDRQDIMVDARDAFINESGRALISKHGRLGDPLFTKTGFTDYADDLLERMVNPYLADTVERTVRDPLRKLGYSDRIFGTMRLCLEQEIIPSKLTVGALAGLRVLMSDREKYKVPSDLKFSKNGTPSTSDVRGLLSWLWNGSFSEPDMSRISDLLVHAKP
ncbi:MAG: hypothetical protein A2283_18260 [Lentisphaerae bacterium RIFOXYA12_FULL_48_11]|nr:MAG: hypothetical protein A2283_18260 [Lentisphaerae bacterium RIFOXYA12_FULL_48_11]